jgi:Asp-tRNA(Asn)/Glu-tRNA(Gln) amidotransferase A subunit family amidase
MRYCISKDFEDVFASRYTVPSPYHPNKHLADFDDTTENDKIDILLAPITVSAAPTLHEVKEGGIKEYINDVLTTPASLAGVPAISLPMGSTRKRLPVGVQLIAPYGHDQLLLSVAHALSSTNL